MFSDTMPDRNTMERLMREIPAYATAEPFVKAELDGIIGDTDRMDPDALDAFGDEAFTERREISEQILASQQGDMFDFLRAPLEEAAEFIGGFDMEGIAEKISSAANKGSGMVRRNSKAFALAAAGTVAATFIAGPIAWVGAGLAGLAGTKVLTTEAGKSLGNKGLAKLKLKDQTPEMLEECLREGIANFEPMVRKLQEAQGQIPAMRENVATLGKANLLSLYKTTLFVAAGREIHRLMVEVDGPLLRSQGEDGNADFVDDNAAILKGKLTILEQARLGALGDATMMGNLLKAVRENEVTLQSILTHEVHDRRSSLAAGSMALDALRLSKVVDEFRLRTERDASAAIKATEQARRMAEDSSPNSPKRLEAQIKRMQDLETMVNKGLKALPKVEAQQKTLQTALDKAVVRVVDAQTKYSAKTESGRKALGGPSPSSERTLHGPA